MTEALYPVGWEQERVPLAEVARRYAPECHPEFFRRVLAWIESEGGKIGIGGGKRSKAAQLKLWLSNPLRFANPLSSFHVPQDWKEFDQPKYAAFDFVVAVKGKNHRSPTWVEGDSAKRFGIHMFIRRNTGKREEPWHGQPIISSYGFTSYGEGNQIRSASVWRSADRPGLERWPLPNTPQPPPSTGGYTVFAEADDIERGSTGWLVERLQRLLPLFGLDTGDLDGIFGPRTEYAVKVFQERRGLTVDGQVGNQTWTSLFAKP